MTSCSWLEPDTLRIHTSEQIHEIHVECVVQWSANHYMIVNKNDMIQAELFFGLNEILIQHKNIGYQCAMNDKVKYIIETHYRIVCM